MKRLTSEELQAWIKADAIARAAFRLMSPDEKVVELARRRAINEAKHDADRLEKLSPPANR